MMDGLASPSSGSAEMTLLNSRVGGSASVVTWDQYKSQQSDEKKKDVQEFADHNRTLYSGLGPFFDEKTGCRDVFFDREAIKDLNESLDRGYREARQSGCKHGQLLVRYGCARYDAILR